MTIQNFVTWLKKQKHRDDRIGDLSRDMIDAKFKLNPDSPNNAYEQLRFSISFSHASHDSSTSEALSGLKEAWSEFKKVKK